jgi:hypothetical protein
MERERMCPLCGAELSKPRKQVDRTDAFSFDCPACGRFEIIGQLLTYWDEGELDEQDQTLLSNLPAAVRRRNDAGKHMSLTFDNWRGIAGTE